MICIIYVEDYMPKHDVKVKFYTLIVVLEKVLGVKLCFRRFFRYSRLYYKKMVTHLRLKILSIAVDFSPIFRVCEFHIAKTAHLLRCYTYQSTFWFLHKNASAGQPGLLLLIETSEVRESNVWRIRRVSKISHFNISK